MLASYSKIHWSQVIIRFECEDEDDTHLLKKYAQDLFPSAMLEEARSDTAEKFRKALSDLTKLGNPWVFFATNNDHPFMGNPAEIKPTLELASEVEKLFPHHVISIQYSHFTESQTYSSFFNPDWGTYWNDFPVLISDTKHGKIISNNKFLCDSIQIFRLQVLIKLFAETKKTDRIIRLEDTEFHGSEIFKKITILPAREWCRHYDGYAFQIALVPPCFIPDGFFEHAIKIRYGYDDYVEGWVNINPSARYVYLGGSADLRCFMVDIPFFWRDRIARIDINEKFIMAEDSLLDDYENLFESSIEPFFFANIVSSAAKILISQGENIKNCRPFINKYALTSQEEKKEIKAESGMKKIIFVRRGAAYIGGKKIVRGRYFCIEENSEAELYAETMAEVIEVSFQSQGRTSADTSDQDKSKL